MDILIKHLLQIPNLNQLQIALSTKHLERSHMFSLKSGQLIKHLILTKEYLNELAKKNISKLTITPDKNQFKIIISFLRSNFPDVFPKPSAEYTLSELEVQVKQFEEMNKYSNKKRYIRFQHEISDLVQHGSKKRNIIVPYNSVLDLKLVERMKKYCSYSEKLECFETEKGVLIITLFRSQEDTLNTIMAATDLVARLEKYFALDVAYEVKEAMDKYIQNQPRLIVFGNYKYRNQEGKDVINNKARYTYLELKNYDQYVKSLFIDQVNLKEQREKLAQEIMGAYKEPYVIQSVQSKKPLPENEKRKYLGLLDRLNKRYTREEYLKLSIQIKSLENRYQLSALRNQLQNIFKLHSKSFN